MLIDRFSPVDVARKVVGVGSVGTRCLILLLEAGDGTPLFLQFKQAVASVLEPYLGMSVFEQAGQRVVEGQRLIQATSDVLLGWARYEGEDGQEIDFYFRQLWDGKGKIDVEELGVCRGRVRVDVAVVNGTLHGYEIKSDRDSLRLDDALARWPEFAGEAGVPASWVERIGRHHRRKHDLTG